MTMIMIIITIVILNVEYIYSLNAMQIKVSSAVAYDFNHLIKAVCVLPRPADLDLCSAPPYRLMALPRTSRPLK